MAGAKVADVLVAGSWCEAEASGSFQARNPSTGELIEDLYPISRRADLERALEAGVEAAFELEQRAAGGAGREDLARFLERYAERIEARAEEIVAAASAETALPPSPRLADVELPRATGQLRKAAAAAREGSWARPTIDTQTGIRSMLGPLGGPVVIFGPNNFPLAFNSISGGDFAAAIAAGNPVIAKAHPCHPRTTRLLAEEAQGAVADTGLPAATVQLIYHMEPEDGRWLVAASGVGAVAYTGSRRAGLDLKASADAAGKPIYLELSSVNPVFVLPGALAERGEELATEFAGSALLAAGQFCTNPGIVVLVDDEAGRDFGTRVQSAFEAGSPGPLLATGVRQGLAESIAALRASGAELRCGGEVVPGDQFRHQNTLLETSGARFLERPLELQREAFGNANLLVFASSPEELEAIAASFEGNLTGSIYSAASGSDDVLHDRVAARLRPRVGRLLNDKMPTGVAVTDAMQHGGPYPATGHPGFTAVGIPASIARFAQLRCYDGVREARLPVALRDTHPGGGLWRSVDGAWTRS